MWPLGWGCNHVVGGRMPGVVCDDWFRFLVLFLVGNGGCPKGWRFLGITLVLGVCREDWRGGNGCPQDGFGLRVGEKGRAWGGSQRGWFFRFCEWGPQAGAWLLWEKQRWGVRHLE